MFETTSSKKRITTCDEIGWIGMGTDCSNRTRPEKLTPAAALPNQKMNTFRLLIGWFHASYEVPAVDPVDGGQWHSIPVVKPSGRSTRQRSEELQNFKQDSGLRKMIRISERSGRSRRPLPHGNLVVRIEFRSHFPIDMHRISRICFRFERICITETPFLPSRSKFD